MPTPTLLVTARDPSATASWPCRSDGSLPRPPLGTSAVRPDVRPALWPRRCTGLWPGRWTFLWPGGPSQALLGLLLALTLLLAGCAGAPREGAGPASGRDDQPGTAAPAPRVQIAVLLPEAGRYAEAGKAVRTGIVAAQTQGGQDTELRFYASRDPRQTPELLRQAAANGASLAIGPLEKEAVEALALQPALPIPTLALNRATSEAAPANLYQFALDPEDEASDAARKAWGLGFHGALLLYPANPWGERLAGGFRREWLGRGGTFAATHAFDTEQPDLPQGLLADALAGSIHAASAECIFLVATAAQARQLWPQILASAPGLPPVFATSHIFEGAQDIEGNQLLTGVQFVEIPWMVDTAPTDPLSRASLDRAQGGLDPRYIRLYAMGIDAYRLLPYLEGLTARPGAYVDGRTGRLSIDDRRRVQRELVLARMDSLGPTRLATLTP